MKELESLPLFASPKQVAGATGLSRYQIAKLLRDRRLSHVVIGSRQMIPRDSVARLIAETAVQACLDETLDHVSASSKKGEPTTSAGPRPGAAGSVARARQIADKLKSLSPSSCASEPVEPDRVIPLRS
jgi:hypothetical protein